MLQDAAWRVPDHELTVFRPARTAYAAVVPVLNEGERLGRQLARMQHVLDDCDVIVADAPSIDGSTDDERLRAANVHAIVRLAEPGGLSSSLRAAFAYAIRAGFEGIVVLDGNDKDDPGAIPRFTAELAAGQDYVQGSRYARGGQAVNTPRHRDLLIRYVHAPLFSLIAGRRFTDTTNGFRGFSRALLLDPRVRPWRTAFRIYELPYYLAWAATRYGCRVTEIPVTRAYPASGRIPTKISLVRGHWQMLKPLLMLALRRY